jgi:hypothetical protein
MRYALKGVQLRADNSALEAVNAAYRSRIRSAPKWKAKQLEV